MIRRVPDSVVRRAIRLNCTRRLARERGGGHSRQKAFLNELRESAIADRVEKPNEQHYEVPAEFFQLVLGPRLKYSCCYWGEGVETLAAAEEAMLALTCERAEIKDGMELLDLGCGWGSLTFWLAERYPACRILAVSNSRTQRAFIEGEARRKGLSGIEVVTADANVFDVDRRFDRVVSVEMLEHARNYEALLDKIATWLEPGGKLFVHVFSHRELAYAYESGWMAKHFFTAGTMPSHDLIPHFARKLGLEEQWAVSGLHYAKTAEAWLDRLDDARADAVDVLSKTYGSAASRRLQMWRIFFMACAELWGYRSGSEWGVSHYRFAKP